MISFETLIERIRSLGEDIKFAGPQSPDAICRLEEALNIKLPPSYCHFLASYGAGGTKGDWIAGIYNNDPLRPNDGYAYGETMRLRREYGLPAGFVVIQSSPPEVVWCLDMRQPTFGLEPPVVAVDVFNGYRTEVIAQSFGAFFREYLEVRAESAK